MNILVNGPSPARGPESWPYLIQQHYGADLVNLAQTGAGNCYIADATIVELTQRKYDLVLIMSSDHRLYDINVSTIDKFTDTIYTSKYQKTMNDWPEKQVWPINDQDYVDDNWVFGCGYINRDPSLVELFDPYYKSTNTATQYFNSYCRLLSLQGFLKSINQPYLMFGVRKLFRLNKISTLYDALDFDYIANEHCIYDFGKRLDSWAHDKLHPGLEAHSAYAKYPLQEIQKRSLVP
jgi:hypothetical protein